MIPVETPLIVNVPAFPEAPTDIGTPDATVVPTLAETPVRSDILLMEATFATADDSLSETDKLSSLEIEDPIITPFIIKSPLERPLFNEPTCEVKDEIP
jgi:hypothetical protein